MILRPYQSDAIAALRANFARGIRRQVLVAPTGCHAAGTPILMSDATLKRVEDVAVSDRVMGAQGPRTVLQLHRGRDEMFLISPVKGEPFVVNGDHILTLVHTETGKLVDLTVRQWLLRSVNWRHRHKLLRCAVDNFENAAPLPIDPWLLGVLLGDGCLSHGGVVISNSHVAVQQHALELAGIGAVSNYAGRGYVRLSNGRSGGRPNPLLDALRALSLHPSSASTKFIPTPYKRASRAQRLHLLAGLLDTDGSANNGGFDYISKSTALAGDVAFVARSLGLAAYVSPCEKGCQNGFRATYWRVSISGDSSVIPTVRRPTAVRRQIKSVLRTGFSVLPAGVGDYFGFEVDGDRRYLMGDFTLTHNSGKSVMAHEVVNGAIGKGKRVLFVVNRIQLVNQFSERLSKAGIFHGIVRGEDTRGAHAPAIVGSIQTIARRGVDPFDVVIIDEAHATPGSKDYRNLVAEHPEAAILGLTATPYAKGMSKVFEGIDGPLFQTLVQAAKVSDLIADGFLVDADVWAPASPDMTGARRVKNAFGDYDYSDEAAAAAMDRPQLVGDIVKHWVRIAPNTLTVVFASSINHSLHIVEEFRRAGVAAEHLSAYTPLPEREEILRRHARGDTRVVACAALLREGWDSPECQTLILARPTRSLTAYIQMAGRVLRPFSGKERAIIIDHSGTALKLGLPTEDREMELDDGQPKESKGGEPESSLQPCPKCGYVDHYRQHLGNRKCPACGFFAQRQPKSMAHADGELVQIKKSATRDEKQKWWSEVLYLCEERGYKPGWAANQYRKRFGVWPRGLMDEPIQPSPETRSWIRSQQIRYAKGMEKARVAA